MWIAGAATPGLDGQRCRPDPRVVTAGAGMAASTSCGCAGQRVSMSSWSLLMVMFAVNGYRQGFVVGALSFAGFFGGALIGLQLGPWLAEQFDDARRCGSSSRWPRSSASPSPARRSPAGSAPGCGTRSRNPAGRRARQRSAARWSPWSPCSLVAWLVAVPLGSSSLPVAGRGGAQQRHPQRRRPAHARPGRALSDALRDTVDTDGFPDVFGDLSPDPGPGGRAARPGAGRLEVVAKAAAVGGEGPRQRAELLPPHRGLRLRLRPRARVMTNAHVVAGTRSVTVEVNGARRRRGRRLRPRPRPRRPLRARPERAGACRSPTTQADTGADAIVIGFPLDGPVQRPVRPHPRRRRHHRPRHLRGRQGHPRDLHDPGAGAQRQLRRPAGRPDGTVLGVIFAAAADDPNTGFAVTADEARRSPRRGPRRTRARTPASAPEVLAAPGGGRPLR